MITAAMATQLKDRTTRSRIGSFSQRAAFKKSKIIGKNFNFAKQDVSLKLLDKT